MIVKEYKFGNTMVRIHDDYYKDKTQEDINEIIKRLEVIGCRILNQNKGEVWKMKMGFVFYKGTKEEVEEKMERVKAEAKEGYPNCYRDTTDGFEIDTKGIRISFTIDRTIHADEYGIYQIFY